MPKNLIGALAVLSLMAGIAGCFSRTVVKEKTVESPPQEKTTVIYPPQN